MASARPYSLAMPRPAAALLPMSVQDPPARGAAGAPQMEGDRRWPSRRQVLQGAACATLIAGLWGCSEPAAALRVGTVPHPACELLFLARELGLLRSREVRLVELLSRADNLLLLEEGALHGAALSLDELMICHAKRLDLRIVAVLGVSEGADALMARAGLSTPRQLRGRRVAVEDSATGTVMLEAALAAASLRLDDVVRVTVTADQGLAQFRAGAVQAVVTAEPWVTQLEALGAVRLFDSTRLPDRLVSVLAVRAELLERQPAAVRLLVAAHFGALERLAQDKAQAWRLMASRLRLPTEQSLAEELPAEQVPQSFRGLRMPTVAAHRELLRPGGYFDQAQQALQQGLIERRLLERSIPLQGLLDTRFLPQA